MAGFLAADGDCCGSSNPREENPTTAKLSSPAKEQPTQSSRWSSGLGSGIELDDEMWEDVDDMEDDEAELNQTMNDLKKRKRVDSVEHWEGEEEVEDIFYDSDCSNDDSGCEPVPEPEPVPVKKKKEPVRKGPTSRSHCSQLSTTPADFVPSDDEGLDVDLDPEDDDGFEPISWVLPNGRKSRAKKKEPRQWYDESRLQPEEGLF